MNLRIDFYKSFLYNRFHSIKIYPVTIDPKGGDMSNLIMGLLIIGVFILAFLLFWIVILSAALLFFGKKEGGEKKRLTEKPEMV